MLRAEAFIMNSKYPFIFLAVLSLALLINSCDQGTSALTDSGVEYEKKLFVWNGLNSWYFWQDEVPALSDKNAEHKRNFDAFLNMFRDEKDLFENLKHRDDRFSWFIDDYEVHEAARLGSSKSFGFRFGLLRLGDSDQVFGYVQYVVRGSPADDSGLKRGDLFNRVNGQRLTLNNYREILASDQYRLGLADLNTSLPENIRIMDSERAIEVTSEVIRENPIHFARTYLAGSKTIGYMVYNAFRFNYHRELNNRFGTFKNDGVDEFILDLRYNSGGALITSALLATLISGNGPEKAFAKLMYSEKRTSLNFTYPFLDELIVYDEDGQPVDERGIVLNTLNLPRVYVITSSRTASASEAVINGLRAHGVDVFIIGERTAGKDEGSITLYDAPPGYTLQSRANLNPNHKRAMQPIIFKIFNANGENYPNGFMPNVEISETTPAYLKNLPQLGEPNEPLFNRAISQITGSFLALRTEESIQKIRSISDSAILMDPAENEFYLIPFDFDYQMAKPNPGF